MDERTEQQDEDSCRFREDLFEVIAGVHAQNRDLDPAEIERDIEESIREVRAASRRVPEHDSSM